MKTDKELRSELLQLLYANRGTTWTPVGMNAAISVEQSERIRVAEQLQSYDLIELKLLNRSIGGQARITAKGVDVVEGSTTPPIAMTIDQRQTINISTSSNFQIGNSNSQQVNQSVATLLSLIESSQAPIEQKEEAKSLLRKVLEHPLVAAIAGGAAGAAF